MTSTQAEGRPRRQRQVTTANRCTARFGRASGTTDLGVATFDFEDSMMDVNGDGRFNSLDVTALNALLNSTDRDDLQWDFNGNGVIGNDDVQLLGDLIDNGLGSGVFGDADQDGDADCDDLDGINSLFGYELGDAEYRIEPDYDLDGDTDAEDRWRVYHLIEPGDFNADGSINSQDFFDFLACESPSCPHADFNGDGNVNSQDFYDFLAVFYSPNC